MPAPANAGPPHSVSAGDRAGPSHISLLLVLVVAVAATLIFYQPFRRTPFDIGDFSEFLTFLHRPSLAQRWDGFIGYYSSMGRWCLLQYGATILKWDSFGTNTVAWQATRFVEMWFIVVAAYFALRRLGADAWGAAAGAGLFMAAGPAVLGWVQLTMGEPLGLCFLLPAVYIAAGYQTTAHWRRDATLVAVCIALALLAKEMLVGFVPFVLVIGCCLSEPGHLALPKPNRRNWWLVGAVTVACIAVLVPVALVAHSAAAGSYGSQYRLRSVHPMAMVLTAAQVLLPVSWYGPLIGGLRNPGNILFICVLVGAAAVIWRRGRKDRASMTQLVAWIALALSLPVIVTIEYAPWYKMEDYYGLPYLFGPAMLLAGGVTAIDRLAPAASRLTWAACAGVILFGGLHAAATTAETMAHRDVFGAVADYLGAHGRGRPVVMRRVSPPVPNPEWGLKHSWPVILGLYAMALFPDSGLLPIRSIGCQDPVQGAADGPPRPIVMTDVKTCGVLGRPSGSFQSMYRAVALSSPLVRTDTIRIDMCDTACEP